MNKKIIAGVIGLLLILSIVVFIIPNKSNKNNKTEAENNTNKATINENNNPQDSNNILVVYFSKTGENYNVGEVEVGNTAMMASYIATYLNADTFEIVPVKKYSDNYKKSTDEAKKEQNENARPAIKNELTNLENYDTIFIGYPIWWSDLPMIVYTFLESYDLRDKTVIPFNTHEGSGSAGTYNTIKNKLPNSNVNLNGLALQGRIARTENGKNQTINWLKVLGY